MFILVAVTSALNLKGGLQVHPPQRDRKTWRTALAREPRDLGRFDPCPVNKSFKSSSPFTFSSNASIKGLKSPHGSLSVLFDENTWKTRALSSKASAFPLNTRVVRKQNSHR
jgi:hypothetical protein